MAIAAGFGHSLGIRGYPRGDLDHDRDVDLDDMAMLTTCLGGPDVLSPPTECPPELSAQADIDNDQDVDLRDVGIMQAVFTGAP